VKIGEMQLFIQTWLFWMNLRREEHRDLVWNCNESVAILVITVLYIPMQQLSWWLWFSSVLKKGLQKIPQIGNVIIGNDVEIGANCDRGKFSSTVLGDGCKIDNLVQIAITVN
jgi:hypothetical protein